MDEDPNDGEQPNRELRRRSGGLHRQGLALGARADRSAAPAAVRAALERLAELDAPRLGRIADAPHGEDALVAVLAASRSLTRGLEFHSDRLEVFLDLEHRPVRDDLTVEALVAWKERELLRIAARDLIGLDDLPTTGSLLAAMARDVLAGACLLAGAEGLAVIGMGKLGGSELNYASDVDVVLVGDGPIEEVERRARSVLAIAERCVRVDTNLRPQGRDGPLVRSLDSYEAYWDRWARPWEFQALLKARPAAGDADLGRAFVETAQRWLWTQPFDAEAIREARRLKARTEERVSRMPGGDREIKQGRGGIRDIEFTVQLLQLVHGHLDTALRGASTLPTLAELGNAGYVDRADAEDLADAYRFLRQVEHRLQLVEEHRTHTVPSTGPELDALARVMGYRGRPDADAAEQFTRELAQHRLGVRTIHERIYFRPLLEAFVGADSTLSPDAAVTRLRAFGFTDAERTTAAVRELTRGLNRASRLMEQLFPLLLDWLSTSPDPDLGLLQLRNLLAGPRSSQTLLDVFRESPATARNLAELLGTSRLVGTILVHNPDLVARLADPARLRTATTPELVAEATAAVDWRDEPERRQGGLRRWKERHLAGIIADDVLAEAPVEQVGARLTAVADAVVETALRTLEPAVPFAVLALGRFGGAELSYASDLDVIFVYEGDGPRAADEANRVASRLLSLVGGETPSARIYDIDPDLRPEGGQGPLARSLEGFVHYWRQYAEIWERLAMVRARPVAGDRDLAVRLLVALDPFVWDGGLDEAAAREIRRMKARIERERIPVGEDPAFHLKLGRGSLSDVEFTTQLLQLREGVRATGTMAALADLTRIGALSEADAGVLTDSYRFCERTRNRWYLVNSAPGDALPTQPEPLRWLARSLGTDTTDLREQYRRVTRRARRVVERVFYGQE